MYLSYIQILDTFFFKHFSENILSSAEKNKNRIILNDVINNLNIIDFCLCYALSCVNSLCSYGL